jgi:iron complex transport system ATP-binding protein
MKIPWILEVTDLVLRREATVLVDHLSLRLASGKILAILGPNGAGKSSLLKGILGILPTVSGEVKLGGASLQALSSEQRAKAVAYVPQHSALNLDWTVEEVVRMGRFAHRHGQARSAQRDKELVKRSMLETDVVHLAQRSFLSLSGGERNRVLIARGLATEAPLMLLDEPTQCLDPAHAIDCLSHLGILRDAGKTVVIVTHDLNQVANLADEILLMRAGRKRAMGPPKQLFESRDIEEVLGVRLIPEAAFGYARPGESTEAACA